MKTNTNSVIGRMILLYNNYWKLYGKQLLLGLGAVAGAIACFHAYLHLIRYKNLNSLHNNLEYNQASFAIFFVIGCLLYCGHAFPILRSKEKSMGYLMLPASVAEKYMFELINRVLFFVIVFPIVYWLTINFVAGIFHLFNPDYVHYKFGFSSIFSHWINGKMNGKELLLFLSLVLLIPTLAFTGATVFRKLPLVKTIVAVVVIVCIYIGYTYFVVEVLGLKNYNPRDNRVLFIHGQEGAKLAGIFAAAFINITLLVMSYFKIKETEA